MAEDSDASASKRRRSSTDQESDSSREYYTPPPTLHSLQEPSSSAPMPKWVLRKVDGPRPYTELNADDHIPPHFTIEPALRQVPLSDPRSAAFHSRDSEILYLCLEATGGLDNVRVDFFEAAGPGAEGVNAVFLGILLSAEDIRRRNWEPIERSQAVQNFIRSVFGPYGVPVRFYETNVLMP